MKIRKAFGILLGSLTACAYGGRSISRRGGSAGAVGRKLPIVYKVLYDIAEGKARSWSKENGQRLTTIHAGI